MPVYYFTELLAEALGVALCAAAVTCVWQLYRRTAQ